MKRKSLQGVCVFGIKAVPLLQTIKTHTIMEIKFDKRNYRKHSDSNKRKIKKSLQECGAGRSVLVDADDTLIAGNGVFEQAQAMGIPTRVIETDGTELVVVKRTDLRRDDDKRKLLALADNATSDNVEWEDVVINADFGVETLQDWGIVVDFEVEEDKQPTSQTGGGLPPELQGLDIAPEQLEKIVGDDLVLKKRIIIVYDPTQEQDVANMIGVESIEKVVYNFDEL